MDKIYLAQIHNNAGFIFGGMNVGDEIRFITQLLLTVSVYGITEEGCRKKLLNRASLY